MVKTTLKKIKRIKAITKKVVSKEKKKATIIAIAQKKNLKIKYPKI